jgi:hypothetical protein
MCPVSCEYLRRARACDGETIARSGTARLNQRRRGRAVPLGATLEPAAPGRSTSEKLPASRSRYVDVAAFSPASAFHYVNQVDDGGSQKRAQEPRPVAEGYLPSAQPIINCSCGQRPPWAGLPV